MRSEPLEIFVDAWNRRSLLNELLRQIYAMLWYRSHLKQKNKDSMTNWLALQTKVVTMLAEIFMVRLEAAARVSEEAMAAGNSKFVSFNPAGPLELKTSATNPDAKAVTKATRDGVYS